MIRRLAPAILLLLALAAVAGAVECFPLPDFPPGYKMPPTTTPPARLAVLAWIDLAVLAACLAAATHFALVLRSRRALQFLALFSLGYFGFYRGGCVCPIGAIQDVAEAISLGTAVPIVVLGFFLLPLLAALVTGRSFCAGACPLGAIQDLVLVRPLKVPLWLEHVLGLAPWTYLGAAVLMAATGGGFFICRYDPFVDFFRLTGPMNMLVAGALLLGVGLFVGRPYCRFLCPYGAILRPLSAIAWRHATITPAECINCRLCEEACPFNAIRKPTPVKLALPATRGKGALIAALAALPVLMLGGAWAVGRAGTLFASANYTVRLADVAKSAEVLGGAEKIIHASPLSAAGKTYSFAETRGSAAGDEHGRAAGDERGRIVSDERGRIVVRCAESAPPRSALWESPPLGPGASLSSPTGRSGLALSEDGATVWCLFKDRQVSDGNQEDVYTLTFLDAKTGALHRHEEYRVDVNLARALADTGMGAAEVAWRAEGVQVRLAWGARALGAFLGLVGGLKLVQLSVRRRRVEFEIDRGRCVSCGRCFKYCPVTGPGVVKRSYLESLDGREGPA